MRRPLSSASGRDADPINERLAQEHSLIEVRNDAPVVMFYPSPYRVGMSSLGYQTLYRILNEEGIGAHRAFLPDAWEKQSLVWPQPKRALLSYESKKPISSYRVIAMSVAYELEITGVIRGLEGAGIPLLARDRGPRDPIIIAGGPLTNSNPSVLLPFVDILICGEGEELLPAALRNILDTPQREAAINAAIFGASTCRGELDPTQPVSVPQTLAKVDDRWLPAHSAIVTPNTELSDMFLVEPERGCSRRCTFCVMRGATTGGMRLLKKETPLALVPDFAKKVGLVGAAVTDHPQLESLVAEIVKSGRGVGISSLRADRLTPEFLRQLRAGGYRTITVASDGISERMRLALDRKISREDLLRAAKLIGAENFHRMKIYQMIGAPGEEDADVDELIAFMLELSKITRIALTFSTFVAKRNTPLDGSPFVGIDTAQERLKKIQSALRSRIEIRPQPPKWAYIEYELAQRGSEAGYAAIEAVHNGGGYSAWNRAFAKLAPSQRPLRYGDEERRARRTGMAKHRPRLPVLSSPGTTKG